MEYYIYFYFIIREKIKKKKKIHVITGVFKIALWSDIVLK
jgi:hypothetical protein